jgi:NADH-ubiquinone oxidoreductase chain 4
MIPLLILIPIIGSLCLIPITENSKDSQTKMKNIALSTSLINFFISIILWAKFDSSTNQIQFVYEYSQLSFCHLNLGIDGISLYFILLTTFLTPIALLSNYNNITENIKTFLISFLILETLQICLFSVLDLFLFYIFFESVLPILFIIIIVYGSGKARIRSAILFFLYTFAGSLFMLLAILQIYSYYGSTDFQLISLYEISLDSQKILWLAFLLAFAVKTPLWPFTGWLYRAHADSPLAGSILLAGTILKFATYGYIRVLLNLLPDASNYFGPLLQTIAIITLIYASLATIIQSDTKVLIAYSSIAHMSVVILGIFSNNIFGIEGAILLALAHGFVSPALFICVGGVIYDRTGTRIISYIRGLVTYMPVFTILFFIFTLCNAGIPLSLNFLGEIMSLTGMFQRNTLFAVLGATGIVFSGCYSIYLYNRLSYGVFSPHLKPLKDLSRREFMLLFTLLIPTVVLGITPFVILDSLHMSLTALLFYIP